MPRLSFAFVMPILFMGAVAAFGQEEPPPLLPPVPMTLREASGLRETLEKITYDARSGPLLFVSSGASGGPFSMPFGFRPAPAPGVTNLDGAASFFHFKRMRAGNITVAAPPEMTLINLRPGKARVFADMRRYEAVKIFVGSLTPAQWKRIGGPGIALGDLSDRQKQMFGSFLPQNPVLRKPRPASDGETQYPFFAAPADYEELDRNQIRLRFTRRAIYSLLRSDKPKETYTGGSLQFSGANPNAPSLAERETGQGPDANGEWGKGVAFGSPLLLSKPNRLKPSHIDYSAAFWDAPVSLSDGGDTKQGETKTEQGETKQERDKKNGGAGRTVDALLKRVSAATGREILADPRVGGLPVLVRSAPESEVRAGDLLQALALGVTGAYRQMGENTFLLTHDIEGIGTQFARLNAWAGQAESERSRVESDQSLKYERPDFAAVLHTLPGDPFPLSDALCRAIQAKDASEDSGRGGLEVNSASLPPAIQDSIRLQGQSLDKQQEPIAVRTDRVRLHIALASEWVLPDGTRLPALDAGTLTGAESDVFGYYPPSRRKKAAAAAKAAPPPAKPLPPELKRRVLLCRPATSAEAEKYAALAKERSFTELWVVVPLDKCDVRPLKAALAAAKRLKTPVYAVLPLFRDCGVGEPDRNILGETGVEFGERCKAEMKASDSPERLREYEDEMTYNWRLFAGWQSIGEAELPDLLRRVQLVARVPGLSGLVLTDSGGPNHTGKRESFEEIFAGGRLGYTARTRLAYLRAEGVDPVDIADGMALPVIRKAGADLPFFPERWFPNGPHALQRIGQEPDDIWQEFLLNENRGLLARIYAVLRADSPSLPLYLDDRASRYGGGNYGYFGSWDAPERPPQNPIWGRARDAAPSARKLSQIVLLGVPEISHSARPRSLTDFTRALGNAGADAQKGWDGLIMDMSALPFAEAARLLSGGRLQ